MLIRILSEGSGYSILSDPLGYYVPEGDFMDPRLDKIVVIGSITGVIRVINGLAQGTIALIGMLGSSIQKNPECRQRQYNVYKGHGNEAWKDIKRGLAAIIPIIGTIILSILDKDKVDPFQRIMMGGKSQKDTKADPIHEDLAFLIFDPEERSKIEKFYSTRGIMELRKELCAIGLILTSVEKKIHSSKQAEISSKSLSSTRQTLGTIFDEKMAEYEQALDKLGNPNLVEKIKIIDDYRAEEQAFLCTVFSLDLSCDTYTSNYQSLLTSLEKAENSDEISTYSSDEYLKVEFLIAIKKLNESII